MPQQFHPVEAQVILKCGNVIDQVVAAVARRVRGHRRLAGATQVQHDQPPERGQAAEIAEVSRIAHRAARQAH
jgi:hypothetical protein